MTNFKLQNQKTISPVNHNQIEELVEFDNLLSLPSRSQIMKRMDNELFEEILEALESGVKVNIEG